MPQVINKPIYSALRTNGLLAAAQYAQEQKLTVVAQNLASTEIPGYKSGTTTFKEVIMKSPNGENISYVRVDNVVYNFDQGGLRSTGVKTHVALNGKGFFKVRRDDKEVYTRNGEFQRSPQGTLIDSQGNQVLSEANDVITLTADGPLHIDQSGNISLNAVPVGKLKLVDFDSYKTLRLQGNSFYTVEDPEREFKGSVQQGVLESSNVSAMNEIVQLTFAHRHFEAAQKMLDEYEKNSKRTMGASARNV